MQDESSYIDELWGGQTSQVPVANSGAGGARPGKHLGLEGELPQLEGDVGQEPALHPPTSPARLPDNTIFSNLVILLGARESGSKQGYSATAAQGQAALARGRGLFRRPKNEQSFAVGREEKRRTALLKVLEGLCCDVTPGKEFCLKEK